MRRAGVVSAFIYLGLSALAAGIFFSITLAEGYTWVSRIGGSVWVFLLFTIVLMPLVIPWAKRRLGE